MRGGGGGTCSTAMGQPAEVPCWTAILEEVVKAVFCWVKGAAAALAEINGAVRGSEERVRAARLDRESIEEAIAVVVLIVRACWRAGHLGAAAAGAWFCSARRAIAALSSLRCHRRCVCVAVEARRTGERDKPACEVHVELDTRASASAPASCRRGLSQLPHWVDGDDKAWQTDVINSDTRELQISEPGIDDSTPERLGAGSCGWFLR